MNRRSIATFLGLASLCGVAALGCDDAQARSVTTRPATQPAQPVSVRVALAQPATIDRTVEVVGTLFGYEEVIISSKSAGRIVSTNADLGDRVASGAVLAQVDPTDYGFALEQKQLALGEQLARLGLSEMPPDTFDPTFVATVQRASVQTENAKARLHRAAQLYNQSPPLISEQEFADIETQYRVYQRDYDVAVLEAQSTLALAKSLEAAVRIAQQQLDDTTVRVPVSQTLQPDTLWGIAERRISIGELVQSGTNLYKLVVDDQVKLRAAVPERFGGLIERGQAVTLSVEASAEPAEGTVTRVSPSVDASSRTFTIEATFDNPSKRLRPGSFARGLVKVGTRNDVTRVPANALSSFAGVDKVFAIVNGKAVEHRVNVIQRRADVVIVEGTLDGATEVAVSGLARLANGSPVNVEAK